MFVDFEHSVLADYHQKRHANALSLNLLIPTPGKLKEECVSVCTNRFDRKDEKIIRDFFGHGGDQQACIRGIQRFETDRFKPLIKFLRGETIKTEEKNIQLLAWLIDFADRPYELGKRYMIGRFGKIEEEEKVERIDEFTEAVTEIIYENKIDETVKVRDISDSLAIDGWRKRIQVKYIALGMLILLGVVAALLFWNQSGVSPGTGSCMYWSVDHYEPIPCNQKMANAFIVALDSVQIQSFRKITTPDTITYRAIGYVWYSKINNEIEFYTGEGHHPIQIHRRLKPVTSHIIETYVIPSMAPK